MRTSPPEGPRASCVPVAMETDRNALETAAKPSGPSAPRRRAGEGGRSVRNSFNLFELEKWFDLPVRKCLNDEAGQKDVGSGELGSPRLPAPTRH